jgi:hypothetical protein
MDVDSWCECHYNFYIQLYRLRSYRYECKGGRIALHRSVDWHKIDSQKELSILAVRTLNEGWLEKKTIEMLLLSQRPSHTVYLLLMVCVMWICIADLCLLGIIYVIDIDILCYRRCKVKGNSFFFRGVYFGHRPTLISWVPLSIKLYL